MTRLSIPQLAPPKPSSVTLSELAIAAGAIGQSVTLCFDGFPMPVLCQLWRYCSRYAGTGEVYHVRTQSDIRKLTESASDVRLALVYTSRLRNPASWSIQMASTAVDGGHTLPALFSFGGLDDMDDDPGTTLVLRGDCGEAAAVARWVSIMPPDTIDWASAPASLAIGVEPILNGVLSPCRAEHHALHRLRDRQLLQALVAGALLRRVLSEGDELLSELNAGIEDYELVRGLLQSRLVAGADEACDPLAADMVRRANVYMSVKFGDGANTGNPFPDSEADSGTSSRPNRELITRREVADLGNIRSHLVRRLVAFLGRQRDGYERFLAMGLIRRPPNCDAWPTMDADDLTSYLRPWSAKQVRTHFEQLRRAGLITAERDQGNGPWRYALPEELNGRHSVFRGLPTAQELVSRAQAG